MPKMKISSQRDVKKRETIRVEMEGMLDESIVGHFEAIWEAVAQRPEATLILDLGKISEHNAFGVGFVAGTVKHLTRHVAGLKLRRVPEGIRTAFARIGQPLRGLLDDGRADGDAYFDHYALLPERPEVQAGVPFTLTVEARDAGGDRYAAYRGRPHLAADRGMLSPHVLEPFTDGAWRGKVILTAAGPVRVRVWDEHGSGEVVVEVVERGDPVDFPVEVACPNCSRRNIAGKSDIHRCTGCNLIYFVDRRAHVVPLKGGRGEGPERELEFRIPSDINFLNHVRNFIVGVSRESRFDEDKIAQIEMSLDEALANVVEHAYAFDANQEIRVRLRLHPDRLEITIHDCGRSFDSDKTPLPDIQEHISKRRVGGLGRYLMNTLMDSVEYRSDGHTNELRMVKRF